MTHSVQLSQVVALVVNMQKAVTNSALCFVGLEEDELVSILYVELWARFLNVVVLFFQQMNKWKMNYRGFSQMTHTPPN